MNVALENPIHNHIKSKPTYAVQYPRAARQDLLTEAFMVAKLMKFSQTISHVSWANSVPTIRIWCDYGSKLSHLYATSLPMIKMEHKPMGG
jgi:hypothetical protein